MKLDNPEGKCVTKHCEHKPIQHSLELELETMVQLIAYKVINIYGVQ